MKRIQIVLVTAPGCHFCEDAKEMLDTLGETFPLSVETIPMSTDAGRDLVVEHRVPFPPILMVDGRFFGFGRISRRRLEKRLTEMTESRVVG